MTKPALLLIGSHAEALLQGALDDRFEIVRLPEGDGADALVAARGADVVATLTNRLDEALLSRLPNLRLIAVPGAGYEHVAVAAATARGIVVANAGNTHSGDVADHAVALILASVHRLLELHAWVTEGRWSGTASPERRHAMSAQRFGVVGLGNIGTAIAERLAPFGGEIAWWSRNDRPAPWPRRRSLLDLANWCTVLVVATNGGAAGLIDAAAIEAVGPDGLVVNISRGAVIDEGALIAALKESRLGGAALDVFADEPTSPERWRGVPNVVLTPHVAGASHEAMERLRETAIQNLASVLDESPVVNEVMS